MEFRTLGRTGLKFSVLGFGCGAVGGLMIRGTPADQERAVARALDLGINYFDTAPMYGDGESERNLGRCLKILRPDVFVGTKVLIPPAEPGRVATAVTAGLEASLRRLGRDSVDLFQLHNPISEDGREGTLHMEIVLEEVVPAFERLRQQGKMRFYGVTALGDTPALHHVIDSRAFDAAQVAYNLLNPSAGAPLSTDFPAQDYGNLLRRTHEAAMGVIGIRVLAGGAMSGAETRHPLGMPTVDPIGTGSNYGVDVRRAKRLEALVLEGHAGSLIEAGLRFVIANDALTSALVGYSNLEQLEYAATSVNKGPLPRAALDRLAALHETFIGEVR